MDNTSQEKTHPEINISTDVSSDFSSEPLFSTETYKSISELSDVLRRIDRRMKNEGFYIRNGKIEKRYESI